MRRNLIQLKSMPPFAFIRRSTAAASEFLKLRRRRFGILILLLSTGLVAGWIRSVFVQDTFEIWRGKRADIKLLSTSHRLMVVTVNLSNVEPNPGSFWSTSKASDTGWEMDVSLADSSRAIVRNTLPKRVITSDSVPLQLAGSTILVTWYQARYWLLLIPLLLLSGLLLFLPKSNVDQLPNLVPQKPDPPRKPRKKRR